MSLPYTYDAAISRMEEVHARMEEIGASGKHRLSASEDAEFSALRDEFRRLEDHADRLRQVSEMARAGHGTSRFRVEAGSIQPTGAERTEATRERDTAMRVIDRAVTDGTLAARGAETIEHLIGNSAPQSRSWTARWAATTADPNYLSAFGKLMRDPDRGHLLFTNEESEIFRTANVLHMEQRAMSLTDNAGGYLIPAQLDPAILLSSNGSTNSIRQFARVVQTAGDTWSGISSAGVSASWDAEAAEVSDDTPTLAQPSIPLYKGAAFVPFSIEIEQDAASFTSEVGKLLVDSIEQLQNTAYVTGSGVGEPTGFITALVAASPSVIVTSDGSEVIADGDAYKLQNALPARFQQNSAFVAHLATINTFRQAETSNGSLLYPSLMNTPPTLLGRPIYEVSNMDGSLNAAATEANYVAAVGAWEHFVICDKIGTVVELVPHLFGSSRRPTGQRGFYCHFRTGSDVVVDNAFRLLNVPTTA